MAKQTKSKVFWSGGSQAVRLPKAMRLDADDVTIERRGNGLLIVPVAEKDDWSGFWESFPPLSGPLKREKTGPAERRRPL